MTTFQDKKCIDTFQFFHYNWIYLQFLLGMNIYVHVDNKHVIWLCFSWQPLSRQHIFSLQCFVSSIYKNSRLYFSVRIHHYSVLFDALPNLSTVELIFISDPIRYSCSWSGSLAWRNFSSEKMYLHYGPDNFLLKKKTGQFAELRQLLIVLSSIYVKFKGWVKIWAHKIFFILTIFKAPKFSIILCSHVKTY